MWGASRVNPLGHWEPRAAVYLNEAILYRHGSAMYDPSLRLQEEGALDAEENAARYRLIRPSFVKLFVEVVAMAHRRRGTWA
jgi:hypothetical protein